jgi:hypothetical protein
MNETVTLHFIEDGKLAKKIPLKSIAAIIYWEDERPNLYSITNVMSQDALLETLFIFAHKLKEMRKELAK